MAKERTCTECGRRPGRRMIGKEGQCLTCSDKCLKARASRVSAAWKRAHPERARELQRKYYWRHPKEMRAKSIRINGAFRKRHRKAYNAYQRVYHIRRQLKGCRDPATLERLRVSLAKWLPVMEKERKKGGLKAL